MTETILTPRLKEYLATVGDTAEEEVIVKAIAIQTEELVAHRKNVFPGLHKDFEKAAASVLRCSISRAYSDDGYCKCHPKEAGALGPTMTG